MGIAIITLAALVSASPAQASAATAIPVPGKVLNLLGTWHCSTFQGNNATHVVVRNTDGSITLRNSVSAPGNSEPMIVDENYRFNPTTSTWSVATSATPVFGAFRGIAPMWTGPRWIIHGNEPLPDRYGRMRETPMRIVYTDLFPAGFRREYQIQSGGDWRDTSEEVCLRP